MQKCAHIPLTDLRQTKLREFLRGLLPAEGMALERVYVAVAEYFGEAVCRPEVNCPHYDEVHPEFHHLVRRMLQDGKDAGEFENGPRGGMAASLIYQNHRLRLIKIFPKGPLHRPEATSTGNPNRIC